MIAVCVIAYDAIGIFALHIIAIGITGVICHWYYWYDLP